MTRRNAATLTPPLRRSPRSVLQFRASMLDIEPEIWRRLLVPSEYTFWDLHVAINDAFAWLDYHLHEWEIVKGARSPTGTKARFGIPDDDPFPDMPKVLPDWEISVLAWLTTPGHRAIYRYDFGDGWEVSVTLEGMLVADGDKYPRCVDGARAGPPEDVGGPPGYAEFLAAIADPRHEEHDEYRAWIGGDFDPEWFDAAKVRFDNPRVRWRKAFGRRAGPRKS